MSTLTTSHPNAISVFALAALGITSSFASTKSPQITVIDGISTPSISCHGYGYPDEHGALVTSVIRAHAPAGISLITQSVRQCTQQPLSANTISRSTALAAARGDITNISLTYDPVIVAAQNRDLMRGITTSKGALVVAAGNNGIDLSGRPEAKEAWVQQNQSWRHAIIVGAWHSYGAGFAAGNYPGENPIIQSRYLLAPADNAALANGKNEAMSGTSSAAARVSAAIATLMKCFPGMTAEKAANALLASASRKGLNEYGHTTCGVSGKVDCGLFKYGQGRMDLNAAKQWIKRKSKSG